MLWISNHYSQKLHQIEQTHKCPFSGTSERPLFINNPEWKPEFTHRNVYSIYWLIRLSVSQTQSTMEALWSQTANQKRRWYSKLTFEVSFFFVEYHAGHIPVSWQMSVRCPEKSQLSVTALDKIHPFEANQKTEPWEMLFSCYVQVSCHQVVLKREHVVEGTEVV